MLKTCSYLHWKADMALCSLFKGTREEILDVNKCRSGALPCFLEAGKTNSNHKSDNLTVIYVEN